MAEENEIDKPTTKLLVLVIAVILGGAGGSLGFRVVDNPRPDPFTGTDGVKMETRLEAKIEKLETLMREHEKEAEVWKLKIQDNKNRLDYHLRNHQ